MLARLYQRRFGIDERDLLEFPILRRFPAAVPRLLFTHAGDAMRAPDEIQVDPSKFEHAKVVLLARHPGDIAVSRYHHLNHRSSGAARRRLGKLPIDEFIWTDQGGIPSIVAFLNQFAAVPNVTIVRYHELIDEPRQSVDKLAQAIGLDVEPGDILDAVEFGSLSNLKRLEQAGYFRSARLRPKRAGDPASGKVRRGIVGGYRAELEAATVAAVDAYISHNLDPDLGFANSPIALAPRARARSTKRDALKAIGDVSSSLA